MAITRFAPSPTGHMHLGHVFSACVATALGDGYVLRIDDIDHTRCRDAFTNQIFQDLEWLGLPWRGAPQFQSDRLAAYDRALADLQEKDLVYPCYLKRAEIHEILSAPHKPDGENMAMDRIAPSTAGALSQSEIDKRIAANMPPAWRLHNAKVQTLVGELFWPDAHTGQQVRVNVTAFGDVILARKDIGTSYHLSVVVDDAMDHISLVTRGADLCESTDIHRVLQALLGLPTPAYFHHQIIADEDGKRLAKRDDARSIKMLRDSGLSQREILALLPPIPEFPT